MTLRVICLAAVVVVAAGCKSADDEYAPAFVPKTYTFEGKVDPKYVGTWKSADGIAKMEIVKDGSLKIDTTTRSVAGSATTHVTGSWLATGDSLMFRYVVGTQQPTVLKYRATLSGASLALQLDGGKAKTIYKRL